MNGDSLIAELRAINARNEIEKVHDCVDIEHRVSRKKEILNILINHAITAGFEIVRREVERVIRERKYGSRTYYDW